MSTLLSTDMILERSSTRLHAPPGGHSSISFGNCEPEAPVRRVTKVQPPTSNPTVFHQATENVRNAAPIMENSYNNIFGGEAPAQKQQQYNDHKSSNIFNEEPVQQQQMYEAPASNNIFGGNATAPMQQRDVMAAGVNDPTYQAATPSKHIGAVAQSSNIFNHEANAVHDRAANTHTRNVADAQRSNDLFSGMSQQDHPKSRARQAPGGTSNLVIG